MLVYTCTLVGTGKLCELVNLCSEGVVFDSDFVGLNSCYNAVLKSEGHCTGVDGGAVLNTRCNDGSLCDKKRNCLSLHVGSHEGTVCVVVFKEGDHGCCNRYHHLGSYIEKVYAVALDLDYFLTVTAGYTLGLDSSVFIQGLCGLCDDILVFEVCRHVADFVCHNACGLVYYSVRSLDKSVVIYLGIGCEIGYKTDVGSFRSLYGAQTAVVAVMYISDLKVCSVSGQTAGAQSRHTAFVSQLGKGVGLIHELREGRGAEELLDDSRHGSCVDERLRCDCGYVVSCHSLTDYALHTGKAHSELILKELADRTQTAVAQMVDIVLLADTHGEVVYIVDCCENIVGNYVLGNEFFGVGFDGFQKLVAAVLLHELGEHTESYLLVYSQSALIAGHEVGKLDHAVGEYNNFFSVDIEYCSVYADLFKLLSLLSCENIAGRSENFTCSRIDNGLSQLFAAETLPDGQLLVELVSSDHGEVISLGIKEKSVYKALRAVECRRLSGTELFVYLDDGVLICLDGGILFESVDYAVIFAEELFDLGVCRNTDSSYERCDGYLLVLVYTNIEYIVDVCLVLDPCTSVRYDSGSIGNLLGSVIVEVIVCSGGSDYLGDDDALCAVDDKGTSLGHALEISHVDLLLLYLLCLLIAESDANPERRRICGVSLLALRHAVLGRIVQSIVQKSQLKVARVVGDDSDIAEDLFEALFNKPLVGLFLNLDEIRHLQNFIYFRKTSAGFTAALDLF